MDGRYLLQCAAEVHFVSQYPFKLLTGGAATAGSTSVKGSNPGH